jgi:hypothetical protein
MENQKLKTYIFSTSAFRYLPNETTGEETALYVEQMPGFVTARSIEQAIELARQDALERWKPENKWFGYKVVVIPTPEDFYHDIENLRLSGRLETRVTEKPHAFYFDEPILEAEIIG